MKYKKIPVPGLIRKEKISSLKVKIHKSLIIFFVEKLEYIDYITNSP